MILPTNLLHFTANFIKVDLKRDPYEDNCNFINRLD